MTGPNRLISLAAFSVCAGIAADEPKAEAPPAVLDAVAGRAAVQFLAYGEFARACTAKLNNDQSQLRETQERLRATRDNFAGLTRDRAKLPQAMTRDPAVNAEITAIDQKIADAKNQFDLLSKQETGFNQDIMTQQQCIDAAETGLKSIIVNPAPSPAAPDKK